MALSNITFFGWEFPEWIEFHKLSIFDELLWFATAIAGIALIVMIVEIILAVKRFQYEKPYVGNILLAVFSLIFAAWTMSGTNLLQEQLNVGSEIAEVIRYALYMVALILFVGYVLYSYFEEVPPVCNALLVVTTCFAIASFVMDTLGAMSLAYGAFCMTLFVALILAVLAILALVRLFMTGKSKYVIYLVSLVLMVGACAFNYCNKKALFAEDYIFDYRLVMDAYLLIIMICGLATVGKSEATKEPEVTLPEEMPLEKEEATSLEHTFDIEIPAMEPEYMAQDNAEPEIVVEDLSAAEEPSSEKALEKAMETPLEEPNTESEETKKPVKKPSYSPHYTDFLTELRNRIFFMEQLSEVQKNNAYEKNVAVVVFDVDDLASINETKGYTVGDQVLRLAATAITTSFGDVGDCARIDGDEFAVVIKDSKPGVISQRLLIMLEAIKNYNEQAEVKVSISFGYAVYSGKGDLNMEALLRMAEKRTEEKRS